MEVKTDYTAYRRLRRKAMLFWVLSGVLAAVSVGSALMIRNPWLIHRMDANQARAEVLDEIADSPSPYIKLDGMELTFTGYYKVNHEQKVCSYCYMGTLQDCYILVDLPAKDQGALVEDAVSEGKFLTDYTVAGQLVHEDEMILRLAEAEGMSLTDYQAYYHMSDLEIHAYNSDQERVRIYQLMALLLAAGALAAGWILWSEAGIAEKEEQEEDV